MTRNETQVAQTPEYEQDIHGRALRNEVQNDKRKELQNGYCTSRNSSTCW
ncbi:MAG: hypothetical protein WA667_20590 [Candidatus Nitrosopolaris sp.]